LIAQKLPDFFKSIFDPPISECITDSLSSVTYVELVKNILNMKSNCTFFYFESLSNLTVLETLCQEFKHFKFAGAQGFPS